MALTQFPKEETYGETLISDPRRPSEPILPSNISSRRLTNESTQSQDSDTKLERLGLKRTISDLERLFNEDLSLTSHAIDQPGSKSGNGRNGKLSIDPHPPNQDQLDSYEEICIGAESPSVAYESDAHMSGINISKRNGLRRPVCKHAATYSGSPERPRLIEIVESYSGQYDTIKTRNAGEHIRRQIRAPLGPEQRNLQDSRQPFGPKASRYHEGIDSHGNNGVHPRAESTERLHANEYTPSPLERDPGQGTLPERGVDDRQLPHKHGVSLRRGSHVSLRGAQGFSLAKSHKRQPIARD